MTEKVDTKKLLSQATNLDRFLAFEEELENAIKQERRERRREIDEERRAREKRARKKRLKAR